MKSILLLCDDILVYDDIPIERLENVSEKYISNLKGCLKVKHMKWGQSSEPDCMPWSFSLVVYVCLKTILKQWMLKKT